MLFRILLGSYLELIRNILGLYQECIEDCSRIGLKSFLGVYQECITILVGLE